LTVTSGFITRSASTSALRTSASAVGVSHRTGAAQRRRSSEQSTVSTSLSRRASTAGRTFRTADFTARTRSSGASAPTISRLTARPGGGSRNSSGHARCLSHRGAGARTKLAQTTTARTRPGSAAAYRSASGPEKDSASSTTSGSSRSCSRIRPNNPS
jgi:hypothetical protein